MIDNEIQDLVCDFGNLYKALYKCKHNVMWKDSVAGYVKNGLVNCYKLKQSLYDDTYKLSKYSIFEISEPKRRVIVSTRIKDRVFQRSLCDNYLTQTVSKSFIYDNCACQAGKGTQFARDRLHTHLQRHYRKYGTQGYVLRCDLSNYFGSTPHKVAIEAIDIRTPDDWAVNQIATIVRSFNQGENPNIGLGLGSQTTQLIQLAVLDDLDHFIKEQLHIKGYVRYQDDFVLLHPDKEYLIECRKRIAERLERLGLKFSPHKTQLFPITQPIKFLGFSYRLKDNGKVVIKILPEKVSREKRKLRKQVQRVHQGLMTKTELDESYRAWREHAKYGDNYHTIVKTDKYYKGLWEVDYNVSVQEQRNTVD